MSIILFLLFGLVVGFIARALMPGRQPMGILATILLGCSGSFLGGFLGNAIAGRDVLALSTAGFLGSVVGAFLVLLVLSPLFTRRRSTI